MNERAKKSGIDWSLFWSGVALLGVLVVWGGFGYWLERYPDSSRGTFGDLFGAPNALFSGFAFVGLVYAILLQREDLRVQRDDLELNRHELKEQRIQLEAQAAAIQQQNFENSFFQLLGLHSNITESIDVRHPNSGEVTKGRDCLKVFYIRLAGEWKGKAKNEMSGEDELVNRIYLVFFKTYQHEIGHYFRSLYNIIKFVDGSSVKDKRLYTNLVRAQLSSYELTLLFYNALSDRGRQKFKPLIEEYALLKSVPEDLLLERKHLEFYAPSAFGK